MRAAEGRQEVIKRVLVGQIDSRHLKTPLVSIALEEVVVSDRGVEEIPLIESGQDYGRCLLFPGRESSAGSRNTPKPGTGVGSGVVGVAWMPAQARPASNSWSAVRLLRSTAGWPLSRVDVAAHALLGSFESGL